MAIEMKEVVSSNIAKIGYDKETQTLYVKFKGGVTWSYAEVKEIEFNALVEASSVGASVGKYFAAKIRPFHQATKVVEELEEKEKS